MRIPIISVLAMLVTSYAANAQQTVTNVPLAIIGDTLFNVPTPLYKIAACNDNSIIGWNGKFFIANICI